MANRLRPERTCMISLIKDMVYAIRTGDGRMKAYYGMALIGMFVTAVGFCAAAVATVICWVAGNHEWLTIILAVVSLALFIVLFILMKKRQNEA